MVGLASELEGKPFHLIASYNQREGHGPALHEIFQNGLSLDPGNVTATHQSRHPKVSGVRFVPYYIVFDHHGDLVYHHQGGPYHGGDGTDVLERVKKMLRDVPKIYVGKESFSTHKKLAAQLESGKLSAVVKKLGKLVEENGDDPEVKRLVAAIERHSRNRSRAIERMLSTDPKSAMKELNGLFKTFDGTPWGKEIATLHSRFADRAARKAQESAAKKFVAVASAYEKLTGKRGNGGLVRNPVDAGFRSSNEDAMKQLKGSLQKIIDEAAELPAGRRAQAMLDLLNR